LQTTNLGNYRIDLRNVFPSAKRRVVSNGQETSQKANSSEKRKRVGRPSRERKRILVADFAASNVNSF